MIRRPDFSKGTEGRALWTKTLTKVSLSAISGIVAMFYLSKLLSVEELDVCIVLFKREAPSAANLPVD